jgi:hypothetical protein
MSIGTTLHPTETAGDGQRIIQSPYLHASSGDKVDRRINCRQCGFPVDLDKRATGDEFYTNDATVTTKTQTFTPPRGALQTDTFGEPQSDRGAGCPLCRSINPEGRLRGKRFGRGINLEGL